MEIVSWLPSHINIRGNELADLEAKSALSLSITDLKIPHSDSNQISINMYSKYVKQFGKNKLKMNYTN